MEKKEILFLFIVITSVFLGQLYAGDRTLFGDDYIFAQLAKDNKFFFTENAHPPFPVWSDILITHIFSLTNRTIRLTSIIFATLTLLLVYLLAKKTIGQKAAMTAALLAAFSAWHIRASQMNSGSDGGMFTFFFYCTIYFFITFLETKQTKHKIATGIAFGLTMLSKETGVLLLPICAIYYIFRSWKTKLKENVSLKDEMINGIKSGIAISLIALLVWSIFPILDIVYNNSQSIDAILTRINNVVIERESTTDYSYLFMTVFSTFKLLIWIGPLLLFLSFLSIVTRRESKQEEEIFILVIIISVLFYLVLTPPNLDRTRYLMITIPALAILSAKYITAKTEEYELRKEWFFVAAGSLVIFIIFLLINQNSIIFSYESSQNPLALLKQGNLNFSIPVFTETDNSGFLLHFVIFASTYAITTLLGCILLLTKHKTPGKLAFILFLSISIGYNFIVAEEYSFHWTSPDYSTGIKEIIAYSQENQLKEPLYLLKNYELQYYLENKYTHFVNDYGISETDEAKIAQFASELDQHGGTVIFTDMPPMDKNGLLWKTITSNCAADYTVTDKGIEIGGVWVC